MVNGTVKRPPGRPPLVNPVHVAVFGVPEPCPYCGGRLAPAFGQIVEDDGTRRPVIDPTSARCSNCGTLFPTAVVLGGGK